MKSFLQRLFFSDRRLRILAAENTGDEVRPMQSLRNFLHSEAGGGVVLVVCALLALIAVNVGFNDIYQTALYGTYGIVGVADFVIEKPLVLWINDGLMAIFFFMIGLEVKREMMEGLLSTWQQRILPGMAAVGGMVVPALVFVAITYHTPDSAEQMKGWAIPSATDIAFAIGIYALVGKHLPTSLKVFLLALAIFDDLGAIVIIALFYSGNLDLHNLYLAGMFLGILLTFNILNVSRASWYIAIGTLMWACVVKSGVHATLAGVVLAFTIPLEVKGEKRSPLRGLHNDLHPLVAFIVLPIFALANAGVYLLDLTTEAFFAPITAGITLGLFVGKPIGIMFFTWLAVKLKMAHLPKDVNWQHILGMSFLAGVGFTMSLFIGSLAYQGPAAELYRIETKIGILAGSILSATVGMIYVSRLSKKHQKFKQQRQRKEAVATQQKAQKAATES